MPAAKSVASWLPPCSMTTRGTGAPVLPVGISGSSLLVPAGSVWSRWRIWPPGAAAAAAAIGDAASRLPVVESVGQAGTGLRGQPGPELIEQPADGEAVVFRTGDDWSSRRCGSERALQDREGLRQLTRTGEPQRFGHACGAVVVHGSPFGV